MRNLLLVMIVTLVGACTGSPAEPELIIGNVTVLSADRPEALHGAWIRVLGERIARVSAEPIEPISPDAQIIDATGRYLIPGLMDSHVHLALMPGIVMSPDGAAPHLSALQQAFEKQQPRSYLYFGVTQLVDLAADQATVSRFEAEPHHPDILFCGAAPIIGGYPTVFMESDSLARRVFPYFIDQAVEGHAPAEDPERHTPDAVVARMQEHGARCTKVHFEDGFGALSNWPMMSDENMQRLIAAARDRGMPVLAHANAFDMQALAVQQDVDIIAHGMWNWIDHRGAPSLPRPVRLLLDRIIAEGIAFQPTFGVMDGIHDTVAGKAMDARGYLKSTPQALLDWYATPEARWFRDELIRDYGCLAPDRINQIQQTEITQGERVAKYLGDNGATLLLGSDTPSSPVYVSQPGYGTYLEIEHMADAGIDLETIFEAATINNARAFDLADDYGTVEPGKIANLLILQEDPLKEITAYDSIETIVLRGAPIAREALSAEHLDTAVD